MHEFTKNIYSAILLKDGVQRLLPQIVKLAINYKRVSTYRNINTTWIFNIIQNDRV